LTEVTLPPNTFYEGSFDDTVTVHMSSEWLKPRPW
jgi:hypothetical protein